MNANERRGRFAFWRRLALWPRLALGVTVGFLVLFAGFSVLGIRAVDASTNRILHERLAITEELADDFDGLLQHRFGDLASFDDRPAPAAVKRRLLTEIFDASGGEFTTLSLLNAGGRRLDLLGPGASRAVARLSAQGWIARVEASGRRAISPPFRDSRGRPVVALAIPPGGHGSSRGLLVATLDLAGPDFMERLDAARRLGSSGHAELVGPGGIALASTEPGATLKPGEHLAFYRTMLTAARPGVADIAVTPHHAEPAGMQHQRHVMAFVRLSAAPWGVALGGTEGETYAPASHLRQTLILAGGGSLAALWLLTVLGARLLVRPVRVLTRAAEEMAGGNLEQTVSVSEGGEIGILGDSLETMRAQLKDSLERVRSWGEQLELKVAERTSELNARNRQLAAVSAIMTAANEAHDLEGMLNRCLDVVLEQTGTDAAAIRLLDSEEGQPALALTRGTWPDFPCQTCSDRFCLDATGADRQPLYLNPQQRKRLHPDCPLAADALSILPLRAPSGLLGILTVASRRGDLPGLEERPVLAAISDQIAVAVENARLAAELRRLEAQHELQRLRSELISAVSHELRTPLGFIKSYATTLLREDTPIEPATQRQFLEIIDEETDKLEHMIDELLDASRLQAGRLPVDRQPVHLGTLLARTIEKARPALHANGHDLQLRLPTDNPLVHADPLRIEQVLDNLLENAARYSDPDSPIQVDLTADDDYALVNITNQGDGIPTAELEQIFEPFYRGQNSRTQRIRGAGLGLAISRGIINAHNGKIWAESSENNTTTFLLTLPLTHARRRNKQPPKQHTTREDGNRAESG